MDGATTVEDVIDRLWQAQVFDAGLLEELAAKRGSYADTPRALADELIARGVLTPFQAERCLAGAGRELVLGPYRFLDLLGEDSLGRTYRARHQMTGRVEAVKVLHAGVLADREETHRFHREAEAIARLSHPNIVAVLDDGTQDGVHYLATEYVDGVGLPRHLEEAGPLDVGVACRYTRQVALAFQHAYERRIVPAAVTASDLIVTGSGAAIKLRLAGRGRLGVSARGLGEFELGALLEPGEIVEDEVARAAEVRAAREEIQAALRDLADVLCRMLSVKDATSLERDRPDERGRRDALVPILGRMRAVDPCLRYETPADCAAALEPFCDPMPEVLPEPATPAPSSQSEDDIPDGEVGVETSRVPDVKGEIEDILSPPDTPALPPRARRPATVLVFLLGMIVGAAATWVAGGTGRVEPIPPPGPVPTVLAAALTEPAPAEPPKPPAPETPPPSAPEPLPLEAPADPKPTVVEPTVAIQKPIDDYPTLIARGELALRENRVDEAIALFGEAVALKPELPLAYVRRAEGFSKKDDSRRVVADCNQAADRGCREALLYQLRGAAYACLGDLGGAIADATEAIARQPDDALSYNTRGVAHFMRLEERTAIDDLTHAVGLDHTKVAFLGNLAWFLATAKDMTLRDGPRAVGFASRACEMTGWRDNVQLRNLAAAFAECREFDRAVEFQALAVRSAQERQPTLVQSYQKKLEEYRSRRLSQVTGNGRSPTDPRRRGFRPEPGFGRAPGLTPPPPPVPAIQVAPPVPDPPAPPPAHAPVPIYRSTQKPRRA